MGFQHETYVVSSPLTDDIEGEAESNLEHIHLVISLPTSIGNVHNVNMSPKMVTF